MSAEKQALIEDVVEREWRMFQSTVNIGGRAGCQDDRTTFQIMRESQWDALPEGVIRSWQNDLILAEGVGWNLVAEKYARMMEDTSPAEYAALRDRLPPVSGEARSLAEQILLLYEEMDRDAARRYPRFRALGRPASESGEATSARTYLRGELLTYSRETLRRYLDYLQSGPRDLVVQTLEGTARRYGFSSLAAAEQILAAKHD